MSFKQFFYKHLLPSKKLDKNCFTYAYMQDSSYLKALAHMPSQNIKLMRKTHIHLGIVRLKECLCVCLELTNQAIYMQEKVIFDICKEQGIIGKYEIFSDYFIYIMPQTHLYDEQSNIYQVLFYRYKKYHFYPLVLSIDVFLPFGFMLDSKLESLIVEFKDYICLYEIKSTKPKLVSICFISNNNNLQHFKNKELAISHLQAHYLLENVEIISYDKDLFAKQYNKALNIRKKTNKLWLLSLIAIAFIFIFLPLVLAIQNELTKQKLESMPSQMPLQQERQNQQANNLIANFNDFIEWNENYQTSLELLKSILITSKSKQILDLLDMSIANNISLANIRLLGTQEQIEQFLQAISTQNLRIYLLNTQLAESTNALEKLDSSELDNLEKLDSSNQIDTLDSADIGFIVDILAIKE